MKDKEFCLSDKISEIDQVGGEYELIPMIHLDNVREFIKRLKEMILYNNDDGEQFNKQIDKLAGDKLI